MNQQEPKYYLNHSILKHLMKRNNNLSRDEAAALAITVENDYYEANKDRIQNQEKDHRKRWEESLQKDSDYFAFEYLTSEELVDYFSIKTN